MRRSRLTIVKCSTKASLSHGEKDFQEWPSFSCLQRTARSLVCLGLLSASTLELRRGPVPECPAPDHPAVNNQQRIMLKGNVRPMPRRARDLGAVDASTPASRVLLLLKRPAATGSGAPAVHRRSAHTRIGELSPLAHARAARQPVRPGGFRCAGRRRVAPVAGLGRRQGLAGQNYH